MRFVCKEFKSHNNTRNLHLAGTLMVTFKLISRGFRLISCRSFQILPPYGGSMDYGPSRTYLSSRSQHFDSPILVTVATTEFFSVI